jgi:hypothetical protein
MEFLPDPECTDINSLYITLSYSVASGKILDFMNYENFIFFMVDIAGVSGAHL